MQQLMLPLLLVLLLLLFLLLVLQLEPCYMFSSSYLITDCSCLLFGVYLFRV